MLELKEKTLQPESKADQEALEKIKGLKGKPLEQSSKNELLKITGAKEKEPIFLFRRLYPEIEKQVIEEKLDIKERGQRFKEFIKAKSNEELLSQAQKRFEELLDENNYLGAYSIAESCLDEKAIQNAGQKLLKKTHERMKESKNKAETLKLAKEIILTGPIPFLSDIPRPSNMVEEAMEALFKLRDKRQKLSEINFYMKLLTPQTLEWLDPPLKNETIFEAAHLKAQKKVFEYLQAGNKKRAAELANNYEKKSLLSLEKDEKLFEEITK